ncbi:hypothetical protein Q9L58_009363 [Maublancomyces gigas]|uniref:Uncharacterized protein n=1 Tax=Discina gigas TaxID=1032678 RepID=A0ABR3G7C8_9PEZI
MFHSPSVPLSSNAPPTALPVPHYCYRGIPFLAFVTPYEVQCARSAIGICDANTFDITSYYLGVLIALSQQAVKFLERGRDAYPARVAYPTEDGEHIIVLTALVPTSFLEKFEQGTDQTDSLEVSRTKITIGDGSSILEFAKEPIASALEPEKPEPAIIHGMYLRRLRRSPANQQHEGVTSVLRVV